MNLAKRRFIINVVFIAVVTIALILSSSFLAKTMLSFETERKLPDLVRKKAELIERTQSTDGVVWLEQDVYFALYNEQGELIAGVCPHEDAKMKTEDIQPPPPPQASDGATDNLPREKQDVLRIKNDDGEYMMYDAQLVFSEYGRCTLRGAEVIGASALNGILPIVYIVALVLAVLAIIASFFSYYYGQKPIRKMASEITEVEKSLDLSKRITLDTKDVDIQNLCVAYNKMLARVENVVKHQERFTADVSHELRSPLTVLLAESEFALNDVDTIEEKDKSLEVIYTQTKRLTQMVKQLLEFSRVAGTESVELDQVDLSALTEQTLNVFSADKGITIHPSLQPEIIVKTNETLFLRLLINLVDNAVKYGKQGGNVWVYLKRDEAVKLIVKDDGIGMSEDTIKHVYERAYQADRSRPAGSGLGLGLSFVKEISRILNLDVQVESKLGDGTKFTVTFK